MVAFDNRQTTLSVSIGVWSAVPSIDEDPARLLNQADAALYEAKHAGRNRLVVAEEPASRRAMSVM